MPQTKRYQPPPEKNEENERDEPRSENEESEENERPEAPPARPADVIVDESSEESFPASDPPSWAALQVLIRAPRP